MSIILQVSSIGVGFDASIGNGLSSFGQLRTETDKRYKRPKPNPSTKPIYYDIIKKKVE
jgi:hypothetical protein